MALLGKLGRALFSECHWEMSEQLTQQSQGSQGRRVVPVERAEYGKSLRCETKAHVGAIQSSMSVIDNAERGKLRSVMRTLASLLPFGQWLSNIFSFEDS